MALLPTQLFDSLGIVLIILASILPISQADRHKQIAAANSHCILNCLNDGYCSYTKYTDYPQKGDVGYYQSCACRPGFGGGSCEKVIEECQPPHYKCHNGAPCEKDVYGSLSCDCSFADNLSELAGYMCRKPAVQACDTLDENNKSYCTNGGVCLSSLTASPKHLMFSEPTVHEGCHCDNAFTGDHCELIKDMPVSSLTKATSSGKSSGAKAGISLSLLGIAAIITAILVNRRRKQHRVRLEQSWGVGGDRFYMDEVATDRVVGEDDDRDRGTEVAMGEDDQESGELKEEASHLQSMPECMDNESELVSFEPDADSKIV